MGLNAPSLTKNQSLVFDALSKARGALSAYDILARLRGAGLSAPPQVYRALARLQQLGLIHRIETLNAFVACRRKHCCAIDTAVFTICKTCGGVKELSGGHLAADILCRIKQEDFQLQQSAVELRGVCAKCQRL